MKKSDLRSGMWVKFRNGEMTMILLKARNDNREEDVITGNHMWDKLDNYDDDLTDKEHEEFDIMEIWIAGIATGLTHFYEKNYARIWKREETCHLTQKEAEGILSETLNKKVEIRRPLNERN